MVATHLFKQGCEQEEVNNDTTSRTNHQRRRRAYRKLNCHSSLGKRSLIPEVERKMTRKRAFRTFRQIVRDVCTTRGHVSSSLLQHALKSSGGVEAANPLRTSLRSNVPTLASRTYSPSTMRLQ